MSEYNEKRKTIIQAMMLGNMATLEHISKSEYYSLLERAVAEDLLEEYSEEFLKRYGEEFGDYVGDFTILQKPSN